MQENLVTVGDIDYEKVEKGLCIPENYTGEIKLFVKNGGILRAYPEFVGGNGVFHDCEIGTVKFFEPKKGK